MDHPDAWLHLPAGWADDGLALQRRIATRRSEPGVTACCDAAFALRARAGLSSDA